MNRFLCFSCFSSAKRFVSPFGGRVMQTGLVLAAVLFCPMAGADEISPEELQLVQRAEKARIEAISRVRGSVVAIYGNNRQGGGSGVLYDPAGFAITNHHVVAAAGDSGWAGLADGVLYRWRLVGTDPGGDVAVIQLFGKEEFPAAPLGLSDTVQVGDWILAMGNPFVLAEDQKPTVTLGIVSGIKRYQAGAGKNTLVYGNCIQIDSSVNPGNSGGPSFNMQGEVVGINGRISAMERGRVNVGVGYAISMKQIRHFLPDLLATKVAQHGTLDAQFGTRGGEVVCTAINLDSPAARAGLELGDRLIRFEGETIRDVNHFTNLISTLPAGWPVEVVHQSGDDEQTFWVRLTALPYEMRKQPQAKAEPAPKKRGDPEKGDAENGETEKDEAEAEPGEKDAEDEPGEKRKIVIRRRGSSFTKQGEINNESLNREVCRHILRQWRADTFRNDGAQVQALRFQDDLVQDEKKVGDRRLTVAADGRFRLEVATESTRETLLYDGEKFLRRTAESVEELAAAQAAEMPAVLEAQVLAASLAEKPFAAPQPALLGGGDKSQWRRAYRLQVAAPDGQGYFLWLSLFDDSGRPDVRLLKTGLHRDASLAHPAVLFDDLRVVSGVRVPFRRALATGLEERVSLEMLTRRCTALTETPEDLFRLPPVEEKK